MILLASGALGMAGTPPDDVADRDDVLDHEDVLDHDDLVDPDGLVDPDDPDDLLTPDDVTDPGDVTDPHDDCAADYDPHFEDDLAAADAAVPEVRALTGPPRRFARPLRRRFRVSARYGIRGNWIAGHHTGIDLAVPRGTPVYAVGSGVVVLARWSGAYGKAVTVRMPDGHYALYAHLNRISVRQGARIRTGTRIGSSGSTGRATGPHLHLEIRSRRGYGSDINPVRYLARRGVRLT
ncbi:M23 family metallopeptidase [Streptomyces spectabilis]|uniref:Murein DD-endopeptidase MepM/ murein hydrolase activator NlpD n=1 Tax=Streptomyces spectabilis TaxID=68270 RepID=A0A7W8EUR4_STRST|nr:M23 family metallopeptidase [Streptomyces spectabilis]MBB5103900.1 murein DD-endopeptidase MepM/ murein hydrolase activator NlpD [Streptomyces spectabilis]MCI3903863.1 M23 family metallopeptidase [Streptomyces spectabilis]